MGGNFIKRKIKRDRKEVKEMKTLKSLRYGVKWMISIIICWISSLKNSVRGLIIFAFKDRLY